MSPHPPGGAPGAGRGEPNPPQWAVADVCRLSGETSRAAHPVPPQHQKVMPDITVCRTAQLGGHTARCPQCACERYA